MTPSDIDIASAINILREARIDASGGLCTELFLLASSLMPVPNVDLLVVNRRNEILLSRRNDDFYPKSWHIPGGCIRYGETMIHRIHETAKQELGCDVEVEPEPIAVRDVIRGKNMSLLYPNERGHNITILYRCCLPDDYQIDNGMLTQSDNGYLKWFAKLPDDFLDLQMVYGEVLNQWL